MLAVQLWSEPGWAAQLVAIVEDVDPSVTSAAFMDYLVSEQTLNLGAKGWIEIGYLSSCTHERITGGVVRIGSERSEVVGGVVERREVPCDKENLAVTDSQAEKAAGSAQRGVGPVDDSIRVGDAAELMLYGAAPLIVAYGAREVTISRLFGPANRQTLPLVGSHGFAQYDFARNRRSLLPGAAYRATVGERSIVFRIDRDAKPGPIVTLSRLILFPRDRR